MSTYLGSPQKVDRVLAAMTERRDAWIRAHFADAPLYLDTMIATGITPRTYEVEKTEVRSIGDIGVMRHYAQIVEGPVYTDPVMEVLRVTT